MNQRQVIVTVVVVGLMSAAIWTWHESSQQRDAALATAKPSAQFQDSFHNPSAAPAVASEPAPVAPPSTRLTPPPASPEANQRAVSPQAQVEPPNVDTPEPAERKFARGGRSDNSDQSPN
jgi:hypothetical protein